MSHIFQPLQYFIVVELAMCLVIKIHTKNRKTVKFLWVLLVCNYCFNLSFKTLCIRGKIQYRIQKSIMTISSKKFSQVKMEQKNSWLFLLYICNDNNVWIFTNASDNGQTISSLQYLRSTYVDNIEINYKKSKTKIYILKMLQHLWNFEYVQNV